MPKVTLTTTKPWVTLKRLKVVRIIEGVSVSAGAAVLANFGREQWNADVYGSLSMASELALMVKNRGRAIRLAFTLRKVDSTIQNFLNDSYLILEGKKNLPPSEEELDLDRVRHGVHALVELSCTLSSIYDQARRHRLTNNSLLAGPLYRIHAQSDEILDLVDWLDTIINPQEVDPLFDRAANEKSRGEVFNLSQVE